MNTYRSTLTIKQNAHRDTRQWLAAIAGVIVAVLTGLASAEAPTSNKLFIYTYHDKPPYYSHINYSRTSLGSDPQAERLRLPEGIYPALVEQLNKQQDQWHLVLRYLPRKRLQLRLDQNNLDGAVIGVSPAWFKDRTETKFLWSKSFMYDKDVIVVRHGETQPFSSAEDLTNLHFALPRGWYFFGITERIEDGTITGFETSSDVQNLKLIIQGRADASVISQPTLKYFVSRLFNADALETLEQPHDEFDRRILFPKKLQAAFDDLKPAIEAITQSSDWLEQLILYDAAEREADSPEDKLLEDKLSESLNNQPSTS